MREVLSISLEESRTILCILVRNQRLFFQTKIQIDYFRLTLADVVQMDALFKDIFDIPIMEKIIKEKFNGQYPVRKSIQTSFAHRGEVGILFQVDAIAFKGKDFK